MAMAMRSPSPALQYPSDAEQENSTTEFADDDDDHQDEMVARIFASLE
jgi:hypothetical protein